VPDQRSLLRGRLASVIDGVADVAAQLTPPSARPAAPPPPPAPPERAWTLALAMEPIATLPVESTPSPGFAPPAEPPADATRPYNPPSHHRFPAAIIGSGLAGLVVAVVVGVHLLPSTSPPAPPQATSPVALTAVRPVAAPARAGGSIPVTQVSFPAGTSTVSIEVDAAATARQAPVEIVVSVGQPAATIIDNSYILNASGATLIPLTAPTGAFPPGDYAVTISESSDNTTLGTTAFEVR
jgi:hypothetical protein